MSFKDIFQTSHSIIILRHEKYGDEYIPICPCYGMWDYKGIKRNETKWKSLDDIYVENDGSYICEWMDDYHSDIEDAVSEICNGMIWCEACDARLVLDPYAEPERISRDVALKRHRDMPKHLLNDCDGDGWEIYDVALARIMQVTPHNMSSYKPISKDTIITKDIVRDIITYGYDDKNEDDENKLKEMGVIYDDCIDCCDDVYDSYHPHYCKTQQMFALPVDSYNVSEPSSENEYPKNMDLSHDGVYIKLICKSQSGKMWHYGYWGD